MAPGPRSFVEQQEKGRFILLSKEGTRAFFTGCRVEKQATLKRFILGEQGNNLQVHR